MKKHVSALIAASILALSPVVASAYTNISPEELKNIISDPKEASTVTIVDVRTEPEFTDGHVEGAVNIPFVFERTPGDKTTRYPNPEFKTQIVKLAKENPGKKLCLICATSHRTEQAANLLAADPAFSEVTVMNVFAGIKGRPGVTGVKELVHLVK